VYVTFEEIKPFLIKNTPESFAFENSPNTSSSIMSTKIKKEFNNNAEGNDENITISTSEYTSVSKIILECVYDISIQEQSIFKNR